MRILLCLLSLASVALGQGDPPPDLLAVPLAEREALLTNLDAVVKRIESGMAKVEKHSDEGFKRELKNTLTAQVNAVASLNSARQSEARTPEELESEIRKLRARLDTPDQFEGMDPATSEDLDALRQEQGRVKAEHDRRKEAVAKAGEALAVIAGVTSALAEKRNDVAEARAGWDEAKSLVADLESSQALPDKLWPAREGAFLKLIVLRIGERDLDVTEAGADPGRLSLRTKEAELNKEISEREQAAAESRLEAISERVSILADEADEARGDKRADLEAKLADAPDHARPFFEMEIGILDAEAHRDRASRDLAAWTSKVATGLLAIDLGEARSLAADLEEEDLGLSTEELADLLLENEGRLERLASAKERLTDTRKRARRRQRDAINRANQFEREHDEDALLAAARAANASDDDMARWGTQLGLYTESVDKWKLAEINLWGETENEQNELSDTYAGLAVSVAELRSRLLWSCEDSLISWAALNRALADASTLPADALDAVSSTTDAWLETAKREENRTRLFAMAGLVLLLSALLWLIHKKLPATYSWFEGREGKNAGLWNIIGAGIRRSEFVFMLGLLYCGICAVWGAWPWETGVVAVLALAPFCYRFLRVLLDVLFHPTDPDDRLIDVDNVLAGVLHRAGRWLLHVSFAFVGVGLLMEAAEYPDRNPGFVEFWWFLYRTTFSIILLVGVCRPSVVGRMIRGEGRVATSMKTLVVVLYPLVVAAVLFLLTLNALGYHQAVDYFERCLLSTVGIVSVAILLYRAMMRRLLPDCDWSRVVRQEDYDDDQRFMADGRSWFWEMLARSGLRLVVIVSALVALAGVWRRMDWGFLHVPMLGGDDGLTAAGLMSGLFAIYATVALVKHYRRWLRFVLLPATKIEQGLAYAIVTLTSYGVVAIGVVVVLNVLRVQGDQIAVVLSALVFGVSFGLKDIVTNLISGIMLLVERPLKVGDQIIIGDQMGTVEKINLRSTTIMTFDNVGVVVPNGDLVTGTLINRSSGTPLLRTAIPVGVGYDSDVRQVMEIIQACLDDHGLVLEKPGPSIYFVGFGDNSLDFSIRFWARMKDNRMQIAGDLRAAMLARFRDADIEIPFPQRDLHLRSADGEAVVHTASVPPPRGPRQTVVGGGSVLGLPQQPSDEDAQRAAAQDAEGGAGESVTEE